MKKLLAMATIMTTVCGASVYAHINDADDILVPTPYEQRVLETTEAETMPTEPHTFIVDEDNIDIYEPVTESEFDDVDIEETDAEETSEDLETVDYVWAWDSDEDTDGNDYIPGHHHVFDHEHIRTSGIDEDGYPYDVIDHYCRCGQYVTEDLIPIDISYTCPDGEHAYEKDFINGEYYEYTCRKCGDWYEEHPEETTEEGTSDDE